MIRLESANIARAPRNKRRGGLSLSHPLLDLPSQRQSKKRCLDSLSGWEPLSASHWGAGRPRGLASIGSHVLPHGVSRTHSGGAEHRSATRCCVVLDAPAFLGTS